MLNAAVVSAGSPSFAELRAREFAHLDSSGQVYLDYTGSALYALSQIDAHQELLRGRLFGNPHSEHAPSLASMDVIERGRDEVLRFFDVDSRTHDVCFTANATAAIKLVAESFPFGPGTPLLLSTDNHNSVNGIREYARRAGSPVHYLPLDGSLRLQEPESVLASGRRGGPGLLAYPAQSNFSGVRHPLSLLEVARGLGHRTLLDAAAFVPSHSLSLREHPADFAAISFYKLFGYPTGVGALVARRDALAMLRRPWFAGGTVLYASAEGGAHRLHPRHQAFEDGTPDFLGIAALPAGFALLNTVGMPALEAHVARLTEHLLCGLGSLHHRNGVALTRIYGPRTMRERGGTVAFNIRDRRGQLVPYWEVEKRAAEAKIALRGGCFCNPGASEAALRLSPARMADCFDALEDDFTPVRFSRCSGSGVGAVRISIGLANNDEDIRRALAFVGSFRS